VSTITIYVYLVSILVFQLGCASKGFNRGQLSEHVGVVKPEFNDQEIKTAFNKKPNLPKEFKLAVYFKAPPQGKNQSNPGWRWTENDKTVLDEIARDLKKEGIVSDVFPILHSLVSDDDLKSLRLAAAKHQADALLIISGAGQIDRYINHLGWTYALLLPALVVPGSEADTLFVSSATLWDVRNEYLYLTAEGEATTNSTHVAAFGKSDKELLSDAKTASLVQLKTELSKMIKGTKLQ